MERSKKQQTMKSVNKYYTSDDLNLFKYAINWKTYFSNKIGGYISGDVLEVGPGIGSNTSFLFKKAHKVNSWTLVEPEINFIRSLEETSNLLNCETNVINSTIDEINKAFDTIIYIDVLEHISDTIKEINNIKSKLKPNGHLIVLVPAYNFLFSEFDKAVGHQKRYNKGLLKSETIGLEQIDLYYLDSIGLFASIANKYFLKKAFPSKANILFWDRILIKFSIFFDKLFYFSFGKSLIGVFKQ